MGEEEDMASKQCLYRMQPIRDRMLADGPTEEDSVIVSEYAAFESALEVFYIARAVFYNSITRRNMQRCRDLLADRKD